MPPLPYSPAASIQTVPAAPVTPTPLNRASSSIDINKDDGDILYQFFEWKIVNTRIAERKAKWERARDIILENDWSIKDLQAMENGVSAIYNRAMKAGISHRLARGFKDKLLSFKVVYKRLKDLKDPDMLAAYTLGEISTIPS
ncbi:hypothetical protein EYZ11_011167 [Aspergillus tanneri]|uniref:Uncharacterized protein n=1 Tax=Aspergillus tanneri TaxID=1220188 RepID=A0A4S3J3G7_9EURO|nr:hypothetical protein EYZ11_011167 [Aspergillus tanneri]